MSERESLARSGRTRLLDVVEVAEQAEAGKPGEEGEASEEDGHTELSAESGDADRCSQTGRSCFALGPLGLELEAGQSMDQRSGTHQEQARVGFQRHMHHRDQHDDAAAAGR
jgi:hypothetical protein